MSKKTESDNPKTSSSNKKEQYDVATQINDSIDVLSDSGTTTFDNQSSDLEPGSKIKRITIERLLGKGGMGSVYLGNDEKLKRKVAVKSIRAEHLLNKSTHERFVREAQILSKINHPSICHIYDYMETEQGDYLVLEYIQGKELHRSNINKVDLLEALFDLANALAAAHKHGIVHRDLKPDNIMITNDGKVKVLDFGIAQSIQKPKQTRAKTQHQALDSNLTQQGSLVGTIRYMSPEQARGEMISTASDIYSLGIIIQELFSQQSAYAAMETEQLLQDVQVGNRLPATDILIPFKSLINKLCQTDPEKRPSAVEVANEINKIRLAPKTKRKRFLQIFISLSLLLLIIISISQWLQFNHQQKSTQVAKSYTQTINNLVKDAEQIYVLPIHNVQHEIANIYQQAEILLEQIEHDPNLNNHDKMRLQGLIFLEAEEFELAVELLEQADADNYLLARAWMALYIEKAGEYADTHGVEKTLKSNDFREKYLEPALKYIQKSTQNDEVMQAFEASQTQSLETGLELLDDILDKQKWNKNAIDLKSQILMAQAESFLQKGNWQQANSFYQQTAINYENAIQMARSYPDNYFELCRVRGMMLFDGVQRTGLNIEQNAQAALQACNNYLITLPEDSYAMNLLARINFFIAQWHLGKGSDSNGSLNLAMNWNKKSLELNKDASNYWTQAMIHLGFSSSLIYSVDEAQQELNLAQNAFNRASEMANYKPAYFLADKIYALALQAELNNRRNIENSNFVLQAEQLYQEGINTSNLDISEKRLLTLQLGRTYYIQLHNKHLNGENIDSVARKLINFYQYSASEKVDAPAILIRLANVQLLLAEYHIENNSPLTQLLDSSLLNIQKAEKIDYSNPALLISKARYLSLNSQASTSNFKETNKQFQKAIDAVPKKAIAHYYWAKSLLDQMKLSNSKTEKNKLNKLSLQQINFALEIDPSNKDFLKIKNRILNLPN